jgi:uncharacterized protein (UPF0212 family)
VAKTPSPLTHQHSNVIGKKVGRSQILIAVAVDIGHGKPRRGRPSWKQFPREQTVGIGRSRNRDSIILNFTVRSPTTIVEDPLSADAETTERLSQFGVGRHRECQSVDCASRQNLVAKDPFARVVPVTVGIEIDPGAQAAAVRRVQHVDFHRCRGISRCQKTGDEFDTVFVVAAIVVVTVGTGRGLAIGIGDARRAEHGTGVFVPSAVICQKRRIRCGSIAEISREQDAIFQRFAQQSPHENVPTGDAWPHDSTIAATANVLCPGISPHVKAPSNKILRFSPCNRKMAAGAKGELYECMVRDRSIQPSSKSLHS